VRQFSSAWPEIISEVLVNLGSAWIAFVVIEPKVGLPLNTDVALLLTARFVFGILSLVLAKMYREAARR